VLDHVSVLDALDARARELTASAAIVIRIDRMDDLPLTPAAQTALYRILNEALTNVVRHAHASRCDVRFATTPESLVAEVIDNGIGVGPREPGRHGVGLSSMAVRANEVGGFVTAGPLPGGGFRVTATLPRTRPSQPGPGPPAISQTLGHGDEPRRQPSATATTKEAEQCPSE
jgi:two-component system sensor histidine kinase DesK